MNIKTAAFALRFCSSAARKLAPILTVRRDFLFRQRNMAQKTITSFFKAPQRLATVNKKATDGINAANFGSDDSSEEENQIAVKPVKRKTLRRISDSDDEKSTEENEKNEAKSEDEKTTPKSEKKVPKTRNRKATVKKESKTATKQNKVLENEEKSPETLENVEKTPENDEKTTPKSETKVPKTRKRKATVKKESKTAKKRNKELANEEKSPETPENVEKTPENVEKNESDDENDEKNEKIAFDDYNPNRNRYDPVKHACWQKGEKVPYAALARTLAVIEETNGRLKMIEILANYFRSVMTLTPDDLVASVYLCLNQLAPAYEGLELGVGDMVVIKAVAATTGRSVDKLKSEFAAKGDLGSIAEASRLSQRRMFQPARLTVHGVFNKLKEIAQMVGNTSMNKKSEKIQLLLVACHGCESRFIVRSLGGKLRTGLAEQSLLVALAQAAVLTSPGIGEIKKHEKEFKKFMDENVLILKTTYCECPNYDKITQVLLEHGIKDLPNHCKITPGIPMKPMLAQPTNGVAEVLKRFDEAKFTCEFKYDGERAQIHVDDDRQVYIYSRNQENNTSKYPDVVKRIPHMLKESVKNCIIDAEAVAWDPEKKQIRPFQILSTRKRKDANESEIKVQVCIYTFDLLFLNGESLVKKPFSERRELLHQHLNEQIGQFEFVKSVDSDNTDEIAEFLDESIKGNCEGLMVKTLTKDASYEIAKRSRNWLKLKKDYLQGIGDTLDLVVIGGYHGKGKRSGSYGGYLLACYDDQNEEYQTICKIGTGFDDSEIKNHSEFFHKHVATDPKKYYSYDTSLSPDVWFDPVQVWEVKCADLSISPIHRAAIGLVDENKGVSLRFPRFIKIRDDKKPEDATTAAQVADMFEKQSQIINQEKTQIDDDDD